MTGYISPTMIPGSPDYDPLLEQRRRQIKEAREASAAAEQAAITAARERGLASYHPPGGVGPIELLLSGGRGTRRVPTELPRKPSVEQPEYYSAEALPQRGVQTQSAPQDHRTKGQITLDEAEALYQSDPAAFEAQRMQAPPTSGELRYQIGASDAPWRSYNVGPNRSDIGSDPNLKRGGFYAPSLDDVAFKPPSYYQDLEQERDAAKTQFETEYYKQGGPMLEAQLKAQRQPSNVQTVLNFIQSQIQEDIAEATRRSGRQPSPEVLAGIRQFWLSQAPALMGRELTLQPDDPLSGI